jgi:hypothetical protein
MIRRFAPFLAAATLAVAAPVAAQTPSQPGLAVAEVSAWIASKGGEVQPVQRAGDDIWISVRDGDLNWMVFFYGCENDVCADLQFAASFSNAAITPGMVNDWNRDRRFLKAFHQPAAEGGEPSAVVQYDLLLQPGGVEQLNDPTAVWVGMLKDFAVHVGYMTAPTAAAPE